MRSARRIAASALLLVLVAGCGSSRPSAPSPDLGAVIPLGHEVPGTVLIDQDGRSVSLRSYAGKDVVLAPFLTLCQEDCPITTAAFQIMRGSVQRDGLGGKVSFVEATIDPGRDTVARLHAYADEFGANWTLLTGSPSVIAAFWKFFGMFYQKVPEEKPPATDWLTGRPLTYDVDHTNGFILIDAAGNERFLSEDLPNLHGQIPANLRRLLDSTGLAHLMNGIPGQSYTIPQALAALSWLVGKKIALSTS